MSLFTKMMSLPGLLRGLDERDVDSDPIVQFDRWYRYAKRAQCYWVNSMAVATATPDGRPSVRLMLLKSVDRRGFVFYSNYLSRKGRELAQNPFAALSLHWVELIRQVRIEGRVEKVPFEEANAYFQSRLRGSRIGAWASQQSEVLHNRAQFDRQVREFERKFAGQEVPLPPFWGGYRAIPDRIEFWQGRPYRLHDRICYSRAGDSWKIARLSP